MIIRRKNKLIMDGKSYLITKVSRLKDEIEFEPDDNDNDNDIEKRVYTLSRIEKMINLGKYQYLIIDKTVYEGDDTI